MNPTKRIHVKSKPRFITFIAIVILALIFGINSMFGLNIVKGNAEQAVITVKVMNGDTLWAIADQYKSQGMDTRQVVYEIQSLNHLNTADVNPGDVIKVPID